MNITLCVPVPNGGQELFKLLVQSAIRASSGQHAIRVHFTYHNEGDDQVLSQDLAAPVARADLVKIPPGARPSLIHSLCVNTLFSTVDSDLAIICDFDMAFTCKNWDEILVKRMANVSLFGARYSASKHTVDLEKGTLYEGAVELSSKSMTFHKYQNGPNCIFLAFVPAQLRSLTDHLCEIGHRFLAGENPGMRLRRIDTESESRCYGIPTGSFLLVDTGSLIPELIQRHDLKYFTLERRSGHFRVLKSAKFSKDYHRIALPEEYFCDGAPYVVHLRKGSKKQKDHCYGPELFAKDVQHRLDSMT